MNRMHKTLAALTAAFLGNIALPAHAAIIIAEVDPSASGNTSYAGDWFELTNTGASTVDITDWRMDDNSNSCGLSRALSGVTSIAPGQSVVFIETADLPTKRDAFVASWFGGVAPAGFTVGSYSGAGVGLSTGGDAVNVFDGVGALITRIDFGASTTNVSFDNAAGFGDVLVSQLSVVGVNGAFLGTDAAHIETGSPGTVCAVPVPGPRGCSAARSVSARCAVVAPAEA